MREILKHFQNGFAINLYKLTSFSWCYRDRKKIYTRFGKLRKEKDCIKINTCKTLNSPKKRVNLNQNGKITDFLVNLVDCSYFFDKIVGFREIVNLSRF